LRVDEIENSDSMLDVATSNEKNDAFEMMFDINIKTMMTKMFN
jgi:hypothetical protein